MRPFVFSHLVVDGNRRFLNTHPHVPILHLLLWDSLLPRKETIVTIIT